MGADFLGGSFRSGGGAVFREADFLGAGGGRSRFSQGAVFRGAVFRGGGGQFS